MKDYYWEIETFDGTIVEIAPKNVDKVKQHLEDQTPIHTTNLSIPANQVKAFRRTERLFKPINLIKAVNDTFFKPELTPDGSIKASWVKKYMPKQIYERKFANIPAYKLLSINGGLALVAFKLAEYQIDLDKVELCTVEEVNKLSGLTNI